MKAKKDIVKKFLTKKIDSKRILRKDRTSVEIKEVKPLPERSLYFKNEFEREKRRLLR